MKPIKRPPLRRPAAGAGEEDVEALPRPITTARSPFITTTASSVSAEPSIQRAESLRTSILSGPTGRMPALTPEAKKAGDERRAYQQAHQWDSAQNRPLAERCITWGFEGPPMMPVGYNSTLQIVQGQGYVAILQEMIHDTRVIPTDGRPHAPSEIKQWMGDSRGHWEGDTLVVETVNYDPQVAIQRADVSDVAKVTERFTRTDADTIRYQFTVNDPKTWVAPFSGEYNMVHIDGEHLRVRLP